MEDFDSTISKKEQSLIFTDLSGVEGFQEMLRKMAVRDMKNYFDALPQQQAEIRGAFYRTIYLRNCISKIGEGSKIPGLRYGL